MSLRQVVMTAREASELIVRDTCNRQLEAGGQVIENKDFPGYIELRDGEGKGRGYIHKEPNGRLSILFEP
jgi:hypothetical protein